MAFSSILIRTRVANLQCPVQWLAQDVQKTRETNLGKGEDIIVIVLKMSPKEIAVEIRSNRLRHSLALSALSRVINLWDRKEEDHFSNEFCHD